MVEHRGRKFPIMRLGLPHEIHNSDGVCLRIWKEPVYARGPGIDTMRVTGHRRRGVSVVVAEVVMIAVLLVAAVMLAGVTFGIFAIYYSPAEVAAVGASCSAVGNSTVCQFTLTNEGTQDTATDGVCSLRVGELIQGSVVDGGTVPAGGSLSGVQCVANGGGLMPGSHISGVLEMTNGASAFFIGTVA